MKEVKKKYDKWAKDKDDSLVGKIKAFSFIYDGVEDTLFQQIEKYDNSAAINRLDKYIPITEYKAVQNEFERVGSLGIVRARTFLQTDNGKEREWAQLVFIA